MSSESDLILNAIFENAADGIITTNARGIIETINPSCCRLFGYTKDDLLNKSISRLMTARDDHRHSTYINNYLNTGEKKIIGIGREVLGKRKDGSEFPFRLSISEVKLDDRIIFTGIIHDITDLKEVERKREEYAKRLEKEVEKRSSELIQSERLYSTVASQFPNGTICILDHDFLFEFVEGRENLFKFKKPHSYYISKKLEEAFPKEISTILKESLSQVFTKKQVQLEVYINRNYFLIIGVAIRGVHNENKLLFITQDITSRKLAEENVRQLLEKEKQLSSLKSRFVSMASHEFRTPLGTILSSVSILEKYTAPEQESKRQNHFLRVKENIRYLTQVLDEFLTVGRFEEGKITISEEHISINDFCSNIIEEMRNLLKDGQEINYTFESDVNIFVSDKKMLRTLFNNLISNAIKYSLERKNIWIRVEIRKGKLLVEIRDEGIGIPEEDQKHLFDVFFRAHNAANIQGTGLGLTIIKKYIDLLKGTMTFESVQGNGTTFKVAIPEFSETNEQTIGSLL